MNRAMERAIEWTLFGVGAIACFCLGYFGFMFIVR